MLEPREYSSARENILAARAIRARFYAKPKAAPKPAPEPPAPVVEEPVAAPIVKPRLIDLPQQLTIVSDVIRATRAEFGLCREEFLAPGRAECTVRPRWIAMAIVRHLTNRSFPDIGRKFNRDHSSVFHAVKRVAPILAVVVPSMSPNASASDWVRAMRQAWEAQQ